MKTVGRPRAKLVALAQSLPQKQWQRDIKDAGKVVAQVQIRKADLITGLFALLVAGPLGMIGSPLAYRYFKSKTKRPRLYWALAGAATLPICWAPLIALFPPETPEQAAARAKDEERRRVADLEAKKEAAKREEAQKFLDWAKGVNPLAGCKTELKSKLRDPGSYQDDWAQPRPVIDESDKTVSYAWSFRSKNGFGGYTSAIAACETTPDKNASQNQNVYGLPKVEIVQN